MENRQPGPEDTKNANNLHVARAEGIAAWLHSQRKGESKRPQDFVDRDEDDDEEEEGKESTNKRRRPLKLGILPISLEEGRESPSAAKPAQTETATPVSVESGDENPARKDHENAHEAEASIEQPDVATEAAQTMQHDALSDVDLAALRDHEEDFRLWEEELRTPGPEVGAADMQMDEEESEPEPQVPNSNSRITRSSQNSHTPRTTSSLRPSESTPAPDASEPPVVAGGGGGNVPPAYRRYASYESPDDPRAATPNVAPAPTRLDREVSHDHQDDHEHEHGHPRLALAMAAGLVVEHMIGKSADKRIEKASRERDEKLSKQIKHNKVVQGNAQQSMEARQTRLEDAQTRQQQAQAEYIRTQVNNVERTAAAGRVEQRQASRLAETENATQLDTESLQSVEHAATLSREAQTEARTQSKIMMEQVAAAAEFDEPVERVYERRQEIKDEPSNPAGAASGGAASVGSVLAKHNPMHQSGGQVSRGTPGQQADQGSAHDQGIDYHAAAIRGVGAGLAIIILALLAYLLL